MLPVLFRVLVLLALAIAISRPPQARALAYLSVVPIGVLVYFGLGIGIARWLGVGRFYSLPLGGEHIADRDMVISLVFWICCAALVIQWGLRNGKRAA